MVPNPALFCTAYAMLGPLVSEGAVVSETFMRTRTKCPCSRAGAGAGACSAL